MKRVAIPLPAEVLRASILRKAELMPPENANAARMLRALAYCLSDADLALVVRVMREQTARIAAELNAMLAQEWVTEDEFASSVLEMARRVERGQDVRA